MYCSCPVPVAVLMGRGEEKRENSDDALSRNKYLNSLCFSIKLFVVVVKLASDMERLRFK